MGKGGVPYNLKIIQAVEKHPCLYDYNLSEYSKRETVSAAWETVAKDVEDTVANCKETWRNLRIVFTRHCKKPLSGPASQKKRGSWLVEAMHFLRPYIQTKRGHKKPINPPSAFKSSTATCTEMEKPAVMENTTFENKDVECATNLDEDPEQTRVPPLKKIKKENLRVYVDTCVMEYIKSKQQSKKDNSKQQFLLSLLPDLEQMNDRQMRQFRTRVSVLIDEILSVEFAPTTTVASSPTSSLTEGQTSNIHAACTQNVETQLMCPSSPSH